MEKGLAVLDGYSLQENTKNALKERFAPFIEQTQEWRERQEREAARAKELAAPDKDKLLAYATRLENVEVPEFTTDKAKMIFGQVSLLLQKTATYIKEQVEKMP